MRGKSTVAKYHSSETKILTNSENFILEKQDLPSNLT